MINRDELLQAIKPFVIRWIEDRTGTPISGGGVAGGDGEDVLVRVSVADLDSGYLDGKITAGTAITKTILNPGASETLEIGVNLTGVDHGGISGLGDDDHTQYLNTTRHAAIDHNALVHAAVTVVDTTTIDFTLAGQQITAGVIPGGIKLDDLGTPDDNTDLNASISRHGLLAKLSNVSANYLNGAGGWATPDHGSIGGLGDDDHTQYFLVNGSRDMGGHIIPALTDAYDLGSSSRLWRKGWLSELDTIVFAENTIVLLGGWFWVTKDQGTLPTSVLAADTTIDFGKAMTVGDFVAMKSSLISEYIQVGTLTTGTIYNVTRDLDGSGANDWAAGAPFAVLGQTGNGRIEFNAYDTPRISILAQGATYNATTELLRIGDLNGSFGVSTELYGLGIGDYAGGNFLRYDPTNDFKIKAGDGAVTISASGLVIEASSGALAPQSAITFTHSGTEYGGLYGDYGVNAKTNELSVMVEADSGTTHSQLHLAARASDPSLGIGITAQYIYGATNPSNLLVQVDDTNISLFNFNQDGLAISSFTMGEECDLTIDGGLGVGYSPSDLGTLTAGNIYYTGDLVGNRGGTEYPGYIFVPLQTPLTSTAWDGDSHSDASKTLIDLSTVFGAPAGIKAIYARVSVRDSGSASSSGVWFGLSPNNTAASLALAVSCRGLPNDYYAEQDGICPCDSNGDIYYQCDASGTGTMDVIFQIWGYYI